MNPKKSTKEPNHQAPNHHSIDHGAMILKSLETLKIKLAARELDELVREATESGMSPWELLDRFLSMPASQSIERAIELAPRFFGFVANALRTARAITGESTTREALRQKMRLVIVGIGELTERLLSVYTSDSRLYFTKLQFLSANCMFAVK